jgi:hypothetical protein
LLARIDPEQRNLTVAIFRVVRVSIIYVALLGPTVFVSFVLLIFLAYLPMIQGLSYEDASLPALGLIVFMYIQPSIVAGLIVALPLTFAFDRLLGKLLSGMKNNAET